MIKIGQRDWFDRSIFRSESLVHIVRFMYGTARQETYIYDRHVFAVDLHEEARGQAGKSSTPYLLSSWSVILMVKTVEHYLTLETAEDCYYTLMDCKETRLTRHPFPPRQLLWKTRRVRRHSLRGNDVKAVDYLIDAVQKAVFCMAQFRENHILVRCIVQGLREIL